MKKTVYQLHGYKIIEGNDLILQWEQYADFGVQQSGRCFVVGRVLVIGKPSHEEIGCLIGEYNDQLKKLPIWSKTKYYCREDAIVGVAAEPSTVRETLSLGADRYSSNPGTAGASTSAGPGSYRLGPYLIEVKPDQTIIWNTYRGTGRMVGGLAEIGGHVLFLLEKTVEEEQNRKQFQSKLKSLPAWTFTGAYVPFGAMNLCVERSSQGSSSRSVLPDKISGPVAVLKRKMAVGPKVDRVPRPKIPIMGAGPDHTHAGDKIDIRALLDPIQRQASSWTHTTADLTRKQFSRRGDPQKEDTRKPFHRSKRFGKAGIAGVLIAVLAVAAFVVVFFHHEFESLAHVIHPRGHDRAHHHRHHSDR